MVRELHQKNIIVGRLCLKNIVLCNYSLVKLGHNVLSSELPDEYRSPEQIIEDSRPTVSDDVFSLGVILYQLLYGQYPFKADDSNQLAKKVKSKAFDKLSADSPL
jgi:serine/threonine protein kinase